MAHHRALPYLDRHAALPQLFRVPPELDAVVADLLDLRAVSEACNREIAIVILRYCTFKCPIDFALLGCTTTVIINQYRNRVSGRRPYTTS